MTDEPLVSVLINNYNYGRFLAEALQSALDQSYRRTEIIVVDDGSTDESRSVLRSYEKRYPGRFRAILKENGGQASAMNAGFAESRGDIVCFLDSDDYWFGAKVERIVPFHRESGVVQHNLLQRGRRYRLLLNTGDLQRFLKEFGLVRSCVPTSAMSFRRDVLAGVFPLPEEPLRLCADVYLRCAAVYASPTHSLDDCLGAYRLHGDNGWHDHLRFQRPDIADEVVELLNQSLHAKGLSPIPKRSDSRRLAFLHSVPVAPGRTYVLYGAGEAGVDMGRRIEAQGSRILAYIDSDSARWGASVIGRPVYGPHELRRLRAEADRIVISCTAVEGAYETLSDMGFAYPDDILVPIDVEGHVTAVPARAARQPAGATLAPLSRGCSEERVASHDGTP